MNKINQNQIRILTWNVGVFQPLTYLKSLGLKIKNHNIEHEFFYKHNGSFVSEYVDSINPDVIILQEILCMSDVDNISICKKYPHQILVRTWGDNNIFVASKFPIKDTVSENEFHFLDINNISIVPLHLNSFSSKKRLGEVGSLLQDFKNMNNLVLIGDTNLWERKKKFLFSNDKIAYKKLVEYFKEATCDILSTHWLGASIDKIFHTDDIKSIVYCDRVGGLFMDHYPVYIDIKKL